MKKYLLAAVAAVTLAGPALAADLVTKAPAIAPAPAPNPWDVAFGAGIANDYIFRGITQSARNGSVSAYFEPRYKVNNWEFYAGIAGASIDFPNRAAAEIDFYGGTRVTWDKLTMDLGAMYYYYPGGTCYYGGYGYGSECLNNSLPNGNVIKANVSFWEVYLKGSYAVTDAFSVGAAFYYSPSVLNTGADGYYISGNAKYAFPAWNGWQFYTSAEIGYWAFGTSDKFYGQIPYADYTTWNIGVGFTYKVFTVDLRYYDTNLNEGNCNAFTSDQTATFNGSFTPINPTGFGSKWCGAAFVAKLSVDLTVNSNLK